MMSWWVVSCSLLYPCLSDSESDELGHVTLRSCPSFKGSPHLFLFLKPPSISTMLIPSSPLSAQMSPGQRALFNPHRIKQWHPSSFLSPPLALLCVSQELEEVSYVKCLLGVCLSL